MTGHEEGGEEEGGEGGLGMQYLDGIQVHQGLPLAARQQRQRHQLRLQRLRSTCATQVAQL